MKKIFSPFYLMLTWVVPYAFLAFYLFYQTRSVLFLPIFLALSCAGFVYYWFYNRQTEVITGKQHRLMAGLSSIAVLLAVILFYSVLDRGDGLLLTFSLAASVPVLYNVCGIASETALDEKQSVLSYAMGIFFIPFSVFLLFNMAMGSNRQSVFLIIWITGIYATLFMLIHIFYILYRRRKENKAAFAEVSAKEYKITFVLALFLPLTGLMLNAGFMGFSSTGGLFGDFSSPIFYIIALLNGGLLMLPPKKDIRLRLFLFFLKSVGYTYILYFFVVFLPVLPVGLIALLFIIGIHAFAPVFITFWQGRLLWREFVFLKNHFNKRIIALVFVAGLLTLPAALYAAVYRDRPNLENAAQYLRHLPPEEYKDVDLAALNRSMGIIDSTYFFTDRRADFLETGYPKGNIPILSNLYKDYVLHNQVMSRDNLSLLRRIFFDEQVTERDSFSGRTSGTSPVKLSKVTVNTTFDSNIQAYRSWIDLELENTEDSRRLEYRTSFRLPEGVYVSDYYLYVLGEKKMGLLTDQRAAVFIYNSIVRKQLDPGLLRYTGDQTLELRVFPFEEHESRKTGFEVIHKQRFEFDMDGEMVRVEGGDAFADMEVPGAVLLSSGRIEKLPRLEREPQYSFVIDSSNHSNIEVLKREVIDYAEQKGIKEASVYFASYKVEKSDLVNMNGQSVKNQGGFNFSLAVKKIFNDTPADRFPIIIAVTENMPQAVLPEKTRASIFPESGYYYALNYNFTLSPYSFLDNAKQVSTDTPIIEKAVSFNGFAVKNDGQSKVVVLGNAQTELGSNQYENAILLRAEILRNAYYGGETTVPHIRKSFRTHILTPATAFIVVETAEQEQELLALQEKMLNGTDEEPSSVPTQSLSEPSIFILIGFLALILFLREDYMHAH